MATSTAKMTCPKCGAEMNHHADKIVYGVTSSLQDTNVTGIDGLLHEFHSCPACGSGATRSHIATS